MPGPILTTVSPAGGGDDADRYVLRDNIGAHLLLKVHGTRTMPTANDPECPTADVDLCELSNGKAVRRDALLFGGPVVDPLRSHVGGYVVVTVAQRNSKAGRSYVCLEPAAPAVLAAAQSWVSSAGDPFAPVLSTPDPATGNSSTAAPTGPASSSGDPFAATPTPAARPAGGFTSDDPPF